MSSDNIQYFLFDRLLTEEETLMFRLIFPEMNLIEEGFTLTGLYRPKPFEAISIRDASLIINGVHYLAVVSNNGTRHKLQSEWRYVYPYKHEVVSLDKIIQQI